MQAKFGQLRSGIPLVAHKCQPQYKLRSLVSLFIANFGNFESVSAATDCAMWCGLPGEEFEIVRESDGAVMAKVIVPDSKLSLFLDVEDTKK